MDKIEYDKGGTQKNNYSLADLENVKCLNCDSGDYSLIHKEFGEIGIVKCKNCKLVYTNPRAKNSEQNYHGDISAYEKEFNLIFKGILPHHRDKNYNQEISIIKKHISRGKLLDVGCNAGRFLYFVVKNGYDGYGVEPSPSLSKLAREKFDLQIENCLLNDSKHENKTFDVITAIDVFEHLNKPKEFLNDCHRLLKDNGRLIIKIPNGNFTLLKFRLAKIIGKQTTKMNIFDSYEHVVHHTRKTFQYVAKINNFKIEKIYAPMPVNSPVWGKYVGQYYQYPSPWFMDWKKILFRKVFHYIGIFETLINTNIVFQPDLMFVLKKNNKKYEIKNLL